jgi:homoserine kinase
VESGSSTEELLALASATEQHADPVCSAIQGTDGGYTAANMQELGARRCRGVTEAVAVGIVL